MSRKYTHNFRFDSLVLEHPRYKYQKTDHHDLSGDSSEAPYCLLINVSTTLYLSSSTMFVQSALVATFFALSVVASPIKQRALPTPISGATAREYLSQRKLPRTSSYSS